MKEYKLVPQEDIDALEAAKCALDILCVVNNIRYEEAAHIIKPIMDITRNAYRTATDLQEETK